MKSRLILIILLASFSACNKGERTFVGTWNYIGEFNSSGEINPLEIDSCSFGSQIIVSNCEEVSVNIITINAAGLCDTIESILGTGEVNVINENYLLIYWNQTYNESIVSNHREFDYIGDNIMRQRGYGYTETYEKQ